MPSTSALEGAFFAPVFGLRIPLALLVDGERLEDERLHDVTSVEADDGVEFLQDTITAAVIRDDDVCPGVRASLEARLATARLKFSVDFNVGDQVIPAPIRTTVPVLLGDEPIEVLAYPKVMVVAEKLVMPLQRGRASTRWRDFADLFMLVPGDLVESEIIDALRAVAEHRGVPLRPLGEVLEGMPTAAMSIVAIPSSSPRSGERRIRHRHDPDVPIWIAERA